MFTTVKVRRGLARDDFRDPGWFAQPPGTRAFEWTGALPDPARSGTGPSGAARDVRVASGPTLEFNVKKPSGSSGHGGH